MDDHTWKAERDRRLRALSDLAQQQQGAVLDPPAAPVDAPQVRSPSRRPLIIAGCAVALVAVLGAGLAYTLARPAAQGRQPAPTLLRITLPGDRMNCAQSAVWSPNGKYIAVLGQKSCLRVGDFSATNTDATGSLLLYDANTGRLARGITLDDAVIPAAVPPSVQHDPSPRDTLMVSYSEMVWSPDSSRVAVTYSTQVQTQSGNNNSSVPFTYTQYGSGLVLVDAASMKRTVFDISPEQWQRMQQQYQHVPTLFYRFAVATRWDLTAGSASVVSLSPALAFAWTPQDTLAPSASPATAGKVGNPDGGQAFTIWQSGSVALTWTNCNLGPQSQGASPKPVGFEYSAFFPTWSPDGRYLILDAFGGARLQHAPSADETLNGATTCTTADPSLASTPLVAQRDAGLGTILSNLTATDQSASVAWNPGGTRIATDANDSTNAKNGIKVYDCATGKLVGKLDAKALGYTDNSDQSGLPFMQWSPDGARLVALLTQGSTVAIWRPVA